MLNKIMNDKYTLFVNTLNLILLPFKEVGFPYVTSIQSKLEELEGDFYTFLHKDYICELFKNGYLSNRSIERVEEIRFKISKINASHWDVESFISYSEWKEVRNLVVDLLINDLKDGNGTD